MKYLNTEICSKCQGNCCKTMGCHFSPDDFPVISIEHLKKELEKGHISIDWWEGPLNDDDEDDRTLFLRMRNKNSSIVDPSWGGTCVLLTDNGCPLEFNKRPKGARMLIPNDSNFCETEYSKYDCCNDWKKHQEILRILLITFH